MKLIFLAGLLMLSACYSSDAVYMKSASGQVAKCGPYTVVSWGDAEANVVRETQCVNDYKEQGFVRVDRP